MRPLRVLALTLCLCSGPVAADSLRPAPFPPGNTVTDYLGVRVADPYRALESTDDPAVHDWLQAQAGHARRTLDALPGRAALLRQVRVLDASRAPVVYGLQITASGRWFYLKRLPGGRSFKLYTRAQAGAPERLLLDPEAWERTTGQTHAINNYSASPDGRHVAAVVSVADSELGELRLIAVATGQQVRPAVPGIWGELVAAWLPDSRSVVYAQGADVLTQGGQPFGKMQLHQRRLDEVPDHLWLGHGQAFGPPVGADDWVWVDAAGADRHVMVVLSQGVSGDLRVWVADREALQRDPATARWTPVVGGEDRVREAVVHGHHLYTRSYRDAGRYRLERRDLDRPGDPLQVVVAERPGVIESPTAAADGLYFIERHGATADLLRLPHGAAPDAVQRVALPFVGAPQPFEANPRVPGVFFSLEGWTRPQQLLRSQGLRSVDTGLVPPDRSGIGRDWVAVETSCPTRDGVEVPMSILHRRGLKADGARPTLMDGYGGYGISEPAYFNRRLDAFLQRGGVFVDVKPRGGGAKGRDWYQAGVGAQKAHTWQDMLACARALIDRGWTRPAKLAITGTSMGGVAVGRAITEQPELFAAAIVNVGITDTVRFIEATSNGPNHALEMGRTDSADGIRQLLAMSTYHQIRDGVRYPATLFTTGVNDKRVEPWIVYKTFARLAAAAAPGRPVLLRVDGAGGHGVSSTSEQRNVLFADQIAFVLWATGESGFQPR